MPGYNFKTVAFEDCFNFKTVALRNVAVNPNWTGATIMCQAALNGETIDSGSAVVDVRYLRQPHLVDASGQGPVLIGSQVICYVLSFFYL